MVGGYVSNHALMMSSPSQMHAPVAAGVPSEIGSPVCTTVTSDGLAKIYVYIVFELSNMGNVGIPVTSHMPASGADGNDKMMAPCHRKRGAKDGNGFPFPHVVSETWSAFR